MLDPIAITLTLDFQQGLMWLWFVSFSKKSILLSPTIISHVSKFLNKTDELIFVESSL